MSVDDYYVSGSYGSPSSQRFSDSYDVETRLSSQDTDARILLMGQRRSGKSSIQRVVFHKMSPHETLFLESTNDVRVKEINNNALVKFQIVDFPGGYEFDGSKSALDAGVVFRNLGSLVYVIDGQVGNNDEEAYSEAIDYFISLAKVAHQINPKLNFDILIHKVDGDSYISDDHKIDCQRDIQQQITDELSDNKLNLHPNFYMTSIYDHSIFEAFSRIVQKLIPQLGPLENLLDSLVSSCGMSKAFLFDIISKIYVATDSTPVDMQTYELCSDMIDVVIDVSYIYGLRGRSDGQAFDADSASVIKLSNSHILYLREATKSLALVCMMKNEAFAKSGLVEYNVTCFKKGITTLFDAKNHFKIQENNNNNNNNANNNNNNNTNNKQKANNDSKQDKKR